MIEYWIKIYFPEALLSEVLEILSAYGTEEWHREAERVKRDALIISRGSLEALKETIRLAREDYRDVLVSEEVDPWVIGELKEHGV